MTNALLIRKARRVQGDLFPLGGTCLSRRVPRRAYEMSPDARIPSPCFDAALSTARRSAAPSIELRLLESRLNF